MDRLLRARHAKKMRSWQDDWLELMFCGQPQMNLACCRISNPDEYLCVDEQEHLMRNLHTTNLIHQHPNDGDHLPQPWNPHASSHTDAPRTPEPSAARLEEELARTQ